MARGGGTHHADGLWRGWGRSPRGWHRDGSPSRVVDPGVPPSIGAGWDEGTGGLVRQLLGRTHRNVGLGAIVVDTRGRGCGLGWVGVACPWDSGPCPCPAVTVAVLSSDGVKGHLRPRVAWPCLTRRRIAWPHHTLFWREDGLQRLRQLPCNGLGRWWGSIHRYRHGNHQWLLSDTSTSSRPCTRSCLGAAREGLEPHGRDALWESCLAPVDPPAAAAPSKANPSRRSGGGLGGLTAEADAAWDGQLGHWGLADGGAGRG